MGAGDDPLEWPHVHVTPFDKEQGDANKIAEYFPVMHFDCVHGSQVMEHLHHPTNFLQQCLHITKPGGWVVMTVPDFDLYEQGHWPSRFNPDHKTTWSLWRDKAPTKAPHMFVPSLKKIFPTLQCGLQCSNYDWLKRGTDQTWKKEDRVEAFIEILIQKQ